MTENDQDSRDEIFSSLKIPDAIKELPKFEGNPRTLHEFIKSVEGILIRIKNTDNTPYGNTLLRAIRSKIEGRADEILNIYGTELNWDEIKTNLILNFADKRNETSLIKDLHSLKQGYKSIDTFYNEIIEIQSTLNSNLLIHEIDKSAIKAKKELFSAICLNTFLSGLREPLGSTIRAMRPETLPVALSFCIEEQNIVYQNSNHNFRRNGLNMFTPPYHPYNRYGYQITPRFANTQYPFPQRRYRFQVHPQSPPSQFNYNRNFNYPNQNAFYANQNPFNNNNYNQNTTTRPYALEAPKQEPMDTNSGHTNFKNSAISRNTYNSRSSRLSRSNGDELHNFDNFSGMTQQHQQNHSADSELNNINDTQNFRRLASNNQQDT